MLGYPYRGGFSEGSGSVAAKLANLILLNPKRLSNHDFAGSKEFNPAIPVTEAHNADGPVLTVPLEAAERVFTTGGFAKPFNFTPSAIVGVKYRGQLYTLRRVDKLGGIAVFEPAAEPNLTPENYPTGGDENTSTVEQRELSRTEALATDPHGHHEQPIQHHPV